MMRSLYSGVSGLKTHQTKMDVIGNNISNVNTVAFKSSSTTFSDIMYQTTQGASGATKNVGGTNAKQIGLGVTNGATKVSITSAGAAQSTGQAFDIRLTDSNSTNFFVVNNGSENLFTRAGSFYVDGVGNLAMTTTGYLVMGWQVSEETGDIVQDTVSPLRIMEPKNLTSSPEATTNGTFSGVIDKNSTDVTSEAGYYRTMTVYDNLGYPYTAKFSIKVENPDDKKYSIELVSITSEQTIGEKTREIDIYKQHLEDNAEVLQGTDTDAKKAVTIFGVPDRNTTRTFTKYDLNKDYTVVKDGSDYKVSYTKGGKTYTTSDGLGTTEPLMMNFRAEDGTEDQKYLTDIFVGYTNTPGANVTWDPSSGTLVKTYEATSYQIAFDKEQGTFESIGDGDEERGTRVVMQLSKLGDEFKDVELDFTGLLNYDNGGSSTVEVERGDLDGTTGAGKKLGVMTSLSVDKSGKIYGSYDNGNTVLLGQIAVAQFANASGLEELGNNCYGTTLNSGDFDGIGKEVTADGGSMSTGQLEMSNVDLSSEFTDMIVTQRGFQANSRIITVSDTLLEELINLKR